MSECTKVEVLIVGAGPIGLSCGIACVQSNIPYLIIEKGALVNSIYHYPLNMSFFSTSEKLEIGDVPFVSHSPKPNRAEALEYYRRVCLHWRLNISLYEEVIECSREDGLFRVTTGKRIVLAQKLIIATGFYDLPNLMGIPGEKLPKVHHYFLEPHPYFKQKIVIVGAANSAVDVAMECWRKGAEVTMVVREDRIRDSVKYWIKPDIENRISEGSIKAYFNAVLVSIGEKQVTIRQNGQEFELQNDFVLAMTGYLPDFSFLRMLGVEIGEDEYQTPFHNPETMMTNVEGLYLAGVICGGLKTNKWFIENSRVHADMIISHINQTRVL